jgi:oligopeptide transport system substrate-binding protein
LIFDKRRIPAELMDKMRDEPWFHDFEVLSTFFYRYNVTREPFKDPRVRRALGMAVDKRRIVENITRGGEKIAGAMTPPGTRGYEAPEGLRYDPDAARRLLADAGYPGGKGFPLFRYLSPNMVQALQAAVELKQMWEKELGVRMEIQQTEWKVFLSEQSRTNFDASYSAWIGDYNDPNTFLDMFMTKNGNNRTGWSNPRYDSLMREANAEADVKKRAALLKQAETILVRDEVPVVPLYFEKGINLYRPDKIGGVWGNLLDEHAVSAMYRKKPPEASKVEGRKSKAGGQRSESP